MKIIKKSVALGLGALMVGSALCGCTQATVFGSYPNDYSWSYKDDTTTLSIGSYIFYSYMAFYDASTRVENGTGDFLDQKLTDDDGKEWVARDYIENAADEDCRYHMYISKVFNDMGLELTAEEITAYEANAESVWSSASVSMEAYGVSKESFVASYAENGVKLEKIFKAMYQEGGEKAVPVEDLKSYYTENYVNYSYFSVPLYNSTTDEEGNYLSEKMSDDEIKAIKTDLQKYTDDINGGTDYADAIKVYMEDYELESDPSYTATNILDEAGLPEDVQTTLEGMKDGEAKYIVIGEDGESPMCYLIYRGDIKAEAENIDTNEDLQYSILANMKSEEFQSDMMAKAKEYKCEVNTEAISKYPCDMFITEPATEASTESEVVAEGEVTAE